MVCFLNFNFRESRLFTFFVISRSRLIVYNCVILVFKILKWCGLNFLCVF